MDKIAELKKFVGSRVRDLRKRAGYNAAEDLAESLKMSATSVYELERGQNWISPEMLLKLSETLNVGVDAFFAHSPSLIKPTPAEALEVIRKAITRPTNKDRDLDKAMAEADELLSSQADHVRRKRS